MAQDESEPGVRGHTEAKPSVAHDLEKKRPGLSHVISVSPALFPALQYRPAPAERPAASMRQ